MIGYFESSVRICPDATFLTCVADNGSRYSYTYWQARLVSASLARRMQATGISQGDLVVIDLPNGSDLVFSILACAYGGYPVLMMEPGIDEAEKISHTLAVERSGLKIGCRIDEDMARQLFGGIRGLFVDDGQLVKSVFGESMRSRAIMGEGQDAVDDTVHFAERAAHLYDENSIACIMFDGGRGGDSTKGRNLKAVPLSWSNLIGAACALNDALGAGGHRFLQERLPFNSFSSSSPTSLSQPTSAGIHQCVLPISSIDGMQSFVRSVIAKAPLYLYGRNFAEFALSDAEDANKVSIALDDLALQELLTVEEWRMDEVPGIRSRLSDYESVLVVGRVRNARTLKRAYDLGASIFASYGSVQTSGVMATMRIGEGYAGGLSPIEGYEVEVVDPDEDGYGRLALRGPGVFSGYLNGRTAFTIDHFYITEERAAVIDGLVFMKKRTENMFVSAGQNIYPIEIADVLRHVPGVAAVHVFPVPDSLCGMLPVAVIERSDPMLTPDDVAETTRQWFYNINVPISIFVYDDLPRTSHGRLDRPAIEAIFAA